MPRVNVVALTLEEALVRGLVVCESCGHPPNNHFMDVKGKPCAHCSDERCTGYVQHFRVGEAIVKPKRLRGPTREVRLTVGQIGYLIAELEAVLEVCETKSSLRDARQCLQRLNHALNRG